MPFWLKAHTRGKSCGGGRTRARGERENKRAKVRTARHKVCPLLCEALAAVGARTGVGTPFPLRLLAETPALWRGVIFEGCPTSEVWKNPYIIIYVYFSVETTPNFRVAGCPK